MTDAIVEKAKKEVEQFDFTEAKDLVSDLLVVDEESQTFAVDVLQDVKAQYKELERVRTTITKPLNEALRATNALFKKPKQVLLYVEQKIKKELAAYQQRQLEANQQKLLEAAQADTWQQAEAAMAEAKPVMMPKGVSIRYVWVPRVVDASKVPREFLTPDIAKLEEYAKEAGGVPDPVAGVVFEQKEIVTARRTG